MVQAKKCVIFKILLPLHFVLSLVDVRVNAFATWGHTQNLLKYPEISRSSGQNYTVPTDHALYHRNNRGSYSESNFHTSPPTRILRHGVWRAPVVPDRRPISPAVDDTSTYLRKSAPNSNPWATLYNTRKPTASLYVKPEEPFYQKPEPAWVSNPKPNILPKKQRRADEYYRHMYGTEGGINYLKTNYGPYALSAAKLDQEVAQELEDVQLAHEHLMAMRNKARCKVPLPEVICVKDIINNPLKEYLPKCTVLHRCGSRSGCCDSSSLVCAPSAMQEVALNFYTVHLGNPTSDSALDNSVEKLFFENHTECDCITVTNPPTKAPHASISSSSTDEPPIISATAASTTTATTSTTAAPTSVATTPQTVVSNINLKNLHQRDDHYQTNDILDNDLDNKCTDCPTPFFRRDYPDGRCTCDCFDKQKSCIRIKRGREALPPTEIRCIDSGRCHIPDCEYGSYNATYGKCPRRPYNHQYQNKNNNQGNERGSKDRWTHEERD